MNFQFNNFSVIENQLIFFTQSKIEIRFFYPCRLSSQNAERNNGLLCDFLYHSLCFLIENFKSMKTSTEQKKSKTSMNTDC